MSEPLKQRLIHYLKACANNPSSQIKRLAIGTFIALLAMLVQIFTSQWASQFLFYLISLVMFAGIFYALPGYLGIWIWRMRGTFFREEKPKETDSKKH